MKIYDTLVIGGGQAGLSMAYFLNRQKLDYLVLDDQKIAGGSWLQTWDSLRLFSPVEYSSLSGWMMPKGPDVYPTKTEFISYLEQYEKRYTIPIQRNTTVKEVIKDDDLFEVITNQGKFYCKTLVSATGTAKQPFIPLYKNVDQFSGKQIHSVDYRNANDLHGLKVLIIGGGNSGAQVLAEVSKVAHTQWVTTKEPHFLPDDIDGRYLFAEANKKFYGQPTENEALDQNVSLANIVMIDSVKEARNRNVLHSKRPFHSFYNNGVIWPDNTKEPFDAVIWCTGFKANIDHLKSLNIIQNNKIETQYTRSIKEPLLWLVGYGTWTGFASATIYGVGKTARHTATEIANALN